LYPVPLFIPLSFIFHIFRTNMKIDEIHHRNWAVTVLRLHKQYEQIEMKF
jgi:hypothetical protein